MKTRKSSRKPRAQALAPQLHRKLLRDHIVRTSFFSFCRRAFETLRRGGQLSDDLYVRVITTWLEKVVREEVKRLILTVPPRDGKTLLASICLAAWELAHNPGHEVLVVSYGEDLARDIAQSVRKILRSDWFVEAFGSLIAKDEDRAGDFRTTKGGRLLATSFGGGSTGRGADLIIVDDPNKIEDA